MQNFPVQSSLPQRMDAHRCWCPAFSQLRMPGGMRELLPTPMQEQRESVEISWAEAPSRPPEWGEAAVSAVPSAWQRVGGDRLLGAEEAARSLMRERKLTWRLQRCF